MGMREDVALRRPTNRSADSVGREELFEAYEKASGLSVDPKHVRWWEAWGG